jgi:hypothetical protein
MHALLVTRFLFQALSAPGFQSSVLTLTMHQLFPEFGSCPRGVAQAFFRSILYATDLLTSDDIEKLEAAVTNSV